MSQEEQPQAELHALKLEVKSDDPQRKRSKRHRMKRNNISDKARVESVKEFGVYARQVEKDYRERYPQKQNFNPFK